MKKFQEKMAIQKKIKDLNEFHNTFKVGDRVRTCDGKTGTLEYIGDENHPYNVGVVLDTEYVGKHIKGYNIFEIYQM